MTKQHAFTKNKPSIALWQQLQQVACVLSAVQGGSRPADFLATLPRCLRAGVQSLSYEVLRNWGVGRWLCEHLVAKRPNVWIDSLLSSTLALCWQQGVGGGSRYTDFTLVNQAVEAVKRNGKYRRFANLVNACLRRFLREREHWTQKCQQSSPHNLPELLNIPSWWLQHLQQDYPDCWLDIVRAGQIKAPMTLRVNDKRSSPTDYIKQYLEPIGMQAVIAGEYALQLQQPCAVEDLPEFGEGCVSVQDAAAQLAAPLLLQSLKTHYCDNNNQQLRILDACAAPGGKTAHLLELADNIELTALDVDAKRAKRIDDTLSRLQLNNSKRVRVRVADAVCVSDWFDGEKKFHGILLDAPCSASGILRRHPDIAWLRRQEDVAQLVQMQANLLDAMWSVLDSGGVLLYCTCSVFHAEGENQIKSFLLRHSKAQRLPAYGHILPNMSHLLLSLGNNKNVEELSSCKDTRHTSSIPSYDGFFYALLHKIA